MRIRLGHCKGLNVSKEAPFQLLRASPAETGDKEKLGANLQGRIPMAPNEFVLSPDGAWLATPLMDDETANLWKMSTTDGSLHPITDFQQDSMLICRQVSWSVDGESIFAALMKTDADIVLLGALQ